MKKGLFCTILLAIVAFSACKKDGSYAPGGDDEYIQGWTRVLGIKSSVHDTSTTKYMQARTETVGLIIVEDPQLRAELMSYVPLPGGQGQYTVRVTNKQECQMILRWNWDDLAIISINPDDSTSGTSQADVIKANQVKTYVLIGSSVPGRIKVKAEKSNSECNNSSTLILEITNTILPIEFTGASTSRVGDKMVVQWSIDAPGEVDTFLVMWTPTGKKEDEVCKYILGSDSTIKKYNAVFPAIKKIK